MVVVGTATHYRCLLDTWINGPAEQSKLAMPLDGWRHRMRTQSSATVSHADASCVSSFQAMYRLRFIWRPTSTRAFPAICPARSQTSRSRL